MWVEMTTTDQQPPVNKPETPSNPPPPQPIWQMLEGLTSASPTAGTLALFKLPLHATTSVNYLP